MGEKGVCCGICAKYLIFGPYSTSTVGGLTSIFILQKNQIDLANCYAVSTKFPPTLVEISRVVQEDKK